jgi:hypothetical protein
MFSIFIIWSYIFLISYIFGFSLVKILSITSNDEALEQLPFSLVIILGLCFVSAFAGYISLFIKIGFIANALIFLGALLLAGVFYGELVSLFKSGFRRFCAIDKYTLALLLISSCFILAKSAAPTSNFDTGLYHAQALRWIEEYPVIPGLGNLHSRLAINSAWYLPYALFGFSFLDLGPFHALNGFLTLVFSLVSLQGLSNLIKKQYSCSNILRAGMALPGILVYKDQLSAPTPDIPAALLTCLLFIYFVQLREQGDKVSPRILTLGIVLLAAFAVTIKLSALPLSLVILVLLGREITRGRPSSLLPAAGGILILVLPFFLRNFWLSGYLLYPAAGLDLFNVDWKIPVAEVQDVKRAILEFGRDPKYLAPPGAAGTSWGWLPFWLPQVITEYRGKLRLIWLASLILLLDWLVRMIRMRTCKIDLRELGKYQVLYLTAAVGLIFWFFTAPDPRFVLGLLMVIAVIIPLPFLKAYDYQVGPPVPWCLGLLLLYFLVAFGVQDLPATAARLWRPAPYPQGVLVREEIQGHEVYFPSDRRGLCWYGPLPCAYHPAKFVFRGQEIAAGFKPGTPP